MRTSWRKRCAAWMTIFVLAASLFSFNTAITSAAVVEETTHRAIAIAFDNSGTMYHSEAWCQATYAVEVFASMLNEGDVLEIYPMNEVKVGSETYAYNTKPLTFHGGEDASSIEQMLTTHPAGDTYTVYGSITGAQAGLEAKSKDEFQERWLILLTDGTEFNKDENGAFTSLSGSALQQRLTADFTAYNQIEGENAYYMGINLPADKQGFTPAITGKDGTSNADGKVTAAELPEKLCALCNRIFGRDEIPKGHYTDGNTKFNIDIPMAKLFVFAQGEGISGISLRGKNGKIDADPIRSLKYSTTGITGQSAPVDKSLQGMLATFSDIDKGDYEIVVEGNAKANVKTYYKPDADLTCELRDDKGNSVLGRSDLYNGDYTFVYQLTDSNGNPLPESDLLGTVTYDLDGEINGEKMTPAMDGNAGSVPVSLNPGDIFVINTIEAKFLKNYHIRKTGADFGFPEGGFEVHQQTNFLDLTLNGAQPSYKLSELENGEMTLTAMFNKEEMSAEEFAKVDFSEAIVTGGDGDGNPIVEITKEGNQAKVKLKYNEDAAHTSVGDMKLIINAKYKTKYGEDVDGGVNAEFTIEDDSKALGIEIEKSDSYFLLADLDKSYVIVHLTLDGQKLTDEQLKHIVENQGFIVTCEDGFQFNPDQEPLYGESAIKLTFLKDQTESGTYKVTFDASYPNSRNEKILPASETMYVEISSIPHWVIWLCVLLGLLILAALIWFILTRKILPKTIETHDTKLYMGSRLLKRPEATNHKNIGFFKRFSSRTSYTIMSPKDDERNSVTLSLDVMPVAQVKDLFGGRKEMSVRLKGTDKNFVQINIDSDIFKMSQKEKKLVATDGKTPATEVLANVEEDSNIMVSKKTNSTTLKFQAKLYLKW